jgi:predicted TIM-barrel fold metal-dependent hydrolase
MVQRTPVATDREPAGRTADEAPLMIISSDGHAGARMADYRPYLDPEFREEFDAFLPDWDERGSRNFDPPALKGRLDPEFIDEWKSAMLDTGRVNGYVDPVERLKDVGEDGICAEVLFPDFGLPFELYAASFAAALGYPPLDGRHRNAGYRAFNRWLANYVATTPKRFAGMAAVAWNDVSRAVAEIRAAHAAGLKGVVLPAFSRQRPLYHEDFEPIWSTLEELGMVANSHTGISSTTDEQLVTPGVPHPACSFRLHVPETLFFCHNILSHLIWGAVLERHPGLKVVFTEQQSDWVVGDLAAMDYAYDGSYYRTDYKSLIRSKPSEYFRRQCYIGSSLFSKGEVEHRHTIGIGKMMLGMDYPHQEGTFIKSTSDYLRTTIGASQTGIEDARRLLGETAAEVFGFDREHLGGVAAEVGFRPSEILTAPGHDVYPRGDVHRPVMWDVVEGYLS